MTLQMLEYFVALAQKGSFTDAANACFVSQPALSRAIASLEKEMGCPIVVRGKNVALTPAGEVLLTEALRVLGQIDVMKERVQRAQHGVRCTLSLGYIVYGMLSTFRETAGETLRQLSEEGVHVETVYDAAQEVKKRLLSGELDGALLPERCVWDMPHCRSCVVSLCEDMVMVPRENPLFESESIEPAELRNERFVFFSPTDLPMIVAKHIEVCREAGFAPDIVAYGRKTGDVIGLLHQYSGVSFVTSSFDYASSSDIRLIPFKPRRRSAMMLVIREKNSNSAIERLFEMIETVNKLK